MYKMTMQPLPDRISITLYGGPGGDPANEGWFFRSSKEWERFKVKKANSTEGMRTVQPEPWHDIDVFSSDDFDSAIRDLRCQRYFGGCILEPL